MYYLSAKLIIKGKKTWHIDNITEAEIIRDSESLSDTCKVSLPKRMKWNNEDKIPIERGDKIELHLGYNDNLELAFVGYVRDVGFKTPISIIAEDEMFLLKTMESKKLAYKSVSIEKLLKDQGLKYKIKVFGEQRLGAYRVKADTIASLLGQLKDEGVRSFFRYENGEAVLYAGVLFDKEIGGKKQVFSNKINMISTDNLEQTKADNMRIKVKAISIMPNGKKVKIEAGDRDGEARTLHSYNKNEKELKAWAEQEIKRLKRDGLQGRFTTFGYKLIDKLDSIAIKIDDDKMGIYLVRKNTIKFSSSGYRQEIEIGTRIE